MDSNLPPTASKFGHQLSIVKTPLDVKFHGSLCKSYENGDEINFVWIRQNSKSGTRNIGLSFGLCLIVLGCFWKIAKYENKKNSFSK